MPAAIIRGVIPLLPAAAGLVLLAAGAALLRSAGDRARIGRILAATPVVAVDRAVELAGSGRRRYVAVGGRITAAAPFDDEQGRPLVLRRTRLEVATRGGWTVVDERLEEVPFAVAGGLATIGVATAGLDAGLVTVVRESAGLAGEVPDRLPAGTDRGVAVRLRVEQLSSVDHALVLGVPRVDPERGPVLGTGLGRPVVVTTLEPAEAMRLLAAGRRGAVVWGSALAAAGSLLLVGGLAWALVAGLLDPAAALAASPTPGAAGDPRSPGEGPGLVGEPLAAILAVVAIAVGATGATLAWVRATGGRRGPGDGEPNRDP